MQERRDRPSAGVGPITETDFRLWETQLALPRWRRWASGACRALINGLIGIGSCYALTLGLHDALTGPSGTTGG